MHLTKSILVLLFVSVTAYAQSSILSLDEAIKIALQKNTTLQKSSEGIKSYESTVKSSYGALLPSVGAQGEWNWSRSEGQGGTIIQGGQLINIPSTQDSRSYSISAGTNWTLFDGLSNFANLRRSKNDLEAARLSLQRLKQDIVFNTMFNYYNILNLKQLMHVREDDLAWNRKNLETISERNKLGAVTMADVYAQQVRVGNSEMALIQVQNDFESQKSDLLNYLGMDVLENVDIIDPVEKEIQDDTTFNDEFAALSSIVDDALNNRYDYRSSILRVQSAKEGVTIARGDYLPTLSNNNSVYSQANKVDDLMDTKVYTVALSLNLPIFSGWATDTRVQTAKVEAKTREIELTELEREIKIGLKKTYLDLQAAQKRLEVSRKNVQSAEQNRRIEQEKYNLGSGTLVNVLLASSEYTLALQTNINNRFDYQILKNQLQYYLGVLDYTKFE